MELEESGSAIGRACRLILEDICYDIGSPSPLSVLIMSTVHSNIIRLNIRSFSESI